MCDYTNSDTFIESAAIGNRFFAVGSRNVSTVWVFRSAFPPGQSSRMPNGQSSPDHQHWYSQLFPRESTDFTAGQRRRLSSHTDSPSGQPTGQPSGQPSMQPSGEPTGQPSGQPSDQPSARPSGQPT